ncbi:hypothetical protein OIB37_16645 [Streptomyces sp. NBC_00820]|uniref:hypothetical protein n=1 Tax=Streptomyces sp. NBC_00820 TaxID=2975842 RepID=UPI002ED6979D|nr:hypothetical protein OIB37_16645 [Streptomyces sp. NBC_00820]
MADVAFGVFVALVVVGGCLVLARAAWLHWTGSERAPDLSTSWTSASPSVARGHERGVVALAAWLLGLTVGIVVAAAGAEVAGGVVLLGSFPLLVCHATIAWFNRPRFLVPPHRRGETGSVVEWWRLRRGVRRPGRGGGQW